MIWWCWCHVNIRIINDLWLGLIDTANVSHYCDLFIQSCNYITTQHPSIWNSLALAFKEKSFKVHQNERLCSCLRKIFLDLEKKQLSDEEWRWQLYCQVSSVHSLQGLGSLIVFPHLIATIITFITFITICINSQESVMERLGLLTPSSTTPILISRKHLECWEDQNFIFISFKI